MREQWKVQSTGSQFSRSFLWSILFWCAVLLLTACDGTQSPGNNNVDGTGLNKAPRFTSDINFSVLEQTEFVTVLSAEDEDGDVITYHIAGGPDERLFDIDSQSAELRFNRAPDFEAPVDSNANNIYMLIVAAADSTSATLQTIAVSVIDATLSVEAPVGHIKTLRFKWPAVNGATLYKLKMSVDGIADYIQVGEAITTTQVDVAVPVYRLDWANCRYRLEGFNEHERIYQSDSVAVDHLMVGSIGYLKSSNAQKGDEFGGSMALSADGKTLAVGAGREASATTGINGAQDDNSAREAGAVYVFSNLAGAWRQQAYIKASNADEGDMFGESVAISADGNILAVAAWRESGAGTDDGEDQNSNAVFGSGAVYVFKRINEDWYQQAYLKAFNAGANDRFGTSIALSDDGSTLAVGAVWEDSNAIGINGDQSNNSANGTGAVYVFSVTNAVWVQQAYIKASNTGAGDSFGTVALSADGNTLAVGARSEDGVAIGINGNQYDNTAEDSGAVYIFNRMEGVWVQQAYIKASNTGAGDSFGTVALSADGNTLAVGARSEDGVAIGINGNQYDNTAEDSGAVYIFNRTDGIWVQAAYIKASNTEARDSFGGRIALSADGNTLAVGAVSEDSLATGLNDGQHDNSAISAGAVYVFHRKQGGWAQQSYVKAPNTDKWDAFGSSVALSGDGNVLAIGASGERSAATGIAGDQEDNLADSAGAVYLY